MTTNQERAAEVIDRHMDDADAYPSTMDHRTIESVATMAAQALVEDGLLMPDPVKPDREYVGGHGQNVAKWETGLGRANGMFSDDVGVFIYINQQKLSVSEARRMAHVLLAAANHAEKAETND